MTAYYNENDPFAAQWLRNLIAENLIATGHVDERSIKEVAGSDLSGFTQVHLFAGIGGWSYALRLAGWPDDREVWTGSCPCQPFSAAGKQAGTADARHLWPDMLRLIAECAPPVVFGEQVASRLGREWLAGVRTDLEALGYAAGCADLCAAGVGAPHIRQRLYWVADGGGGELARRTQQPTREELPAVERGRSDGVLGVGNSSSTRSGRDTGEISGAQGSVERSLRREPDELVASGAGMADTVSAGRPERRTSAGNRPSPWAGAAYIPCADGKARRAEPSIQPLAHGIPNRVGTLRGAGNAVVPQAAQAFIEAYICCD